MNSKECTGCRLEKPLHEFTRAAKNKSGYAAQCLCCTGQRGRAWHEKNRTVSNERARLYNHKTPGALAKIRATHDKPGRGRAYSAIFHAVRAGRLIKPDACPKCARTDRRIEAHHFKGYDFPLEIEWLCASCHRIVDYALKRTLV